jgi:uncharacterized protein YukE
VGNNTNRRGTDHGATRHSHGYTDFAAYSHPELYNMLFASDPATIREASSAWEYTGRMLGEQATGLQRRLVSFEQMWQGRAADEYKLMITDLARGLEKVAAAATAMKNLVADSAESVDRARAAMPVPQPVSDLDPLVMAAATAPPPPEIAMMPGAHAQFAADQRRAQQAVRQHQAQLDAARNEHDQAVAVMRNLGGEYSTTEDSIPASPTSVSPPGSQPDNTEPILTGTSNGITATPALTEPGTPAGAGQDLDGSSGPSGSTGGSATVPNSPLFGHMFTAGLAAASAAAMRRFGSVMPRLPNFLTPKPKDDKGAEAKSKSPAGARTPGLGGSGGLGGGLGGGGGFGGGGFGGTGPGSPASAYPGLVSGAGSAAGVAAGAASNLGAAAGASGAPGGFIPAMPMGGMAGAGGDANGRRIPAWLVETEDVWGESSTVSPTVIGEDSSS